MAWYIRVWSASYWFLWKRSTIIQLTGKLHKECPWLQYFWMAQPWAFFSSAESAQLGGTCQLGSGPTDCGDSRTWLKSKVALCEWTLLDSDCVALQDKWPELIWRPSERFPFHATAPIPELPLLYRTANLPRWMLKLSWLPRVLIRTHLSSAANTYRHEFLLPCDSWSW